MHKKIIVNQTCPYCGNEVNDVLEESGGNRDAEWIKTKQGVNNIFTYHAFMQQLRGQLFKMLTELLLH